MAFVTRVGHAALTWALSAAALAVFAGGAAASEPLPWQMGFQPAASPTAERIGILNDVLMIIIVGTVVFVLGLLLYVIWRFAEKRNPTPSKTTHNTFVEVVWTVFPVVILIIIAVPSFKLLYFADRVEEAEMTVKAIGRQWYWSYEYPDHGNFAFDAIMVPDDELQPGQKRLLDTDLSVVLPVDTDIRLLITASDVLHAFAVPAFGIKLDAVPGRVNETWVRINQPGTYYGQCSEICGTGHSYMPIKVVAVSKADFESWVAQAKEEFARVDEPDQGVRLAEAAGAAPARAD
jgi:cytochrome c oxidase subunit 2